MMYLIAQTWLFLAISCLIGMLMMYFLVRNQKSERQTQLEAEALDARLYDFFAANQNWFEDFLIECHLHGLEHASGCVVWVGGNVGHRVNSACWHTRRIECLQYLRHTAWQRPVANRGIDLLHTRHAACIVCQIWRLA